jgi:hypothetical protein
MGLKARESSAIFFSHIVESEMARRKARVGEADLSKDVLDIIDARPNKQITTTELIAELRKRIPLTDEDKEILAKRQDDRFSQIVRNIKSHKATPGNLIYEGILADIPRGFRKVK